MTDIPEGSITEWPTCTYDGCKQRGKLGLCATGTREFHYYCAAHLPQPDADYARWYRLNSTMPGKSPDE